MDEKSDAQLLREYAECGNESGFRELVERHADLIYSSALRQMTSPDLARDVAQSVFTDLARKASSLSATRDGNASLLGWLYRSTRFAALTQLRDERRRHARERHVMEYFNPASETAPDWERVGPVLDEAMADLSDEDREALLLRFFKNRDFRAIGIALGVSDDTAQKRVSRALEKLRSYLRQRNVTTSAVALSTALSVNAVQAAPIGLSAMLSSAAITGGTVSAAAMMSAGKTLIMTTTQKALITTFLVAAVVTGIYEVVQNSRLRNDLQRMEQQLKPLTEQNEQLRRERNEAVRQLAGLNNDNERLNRNASELLKLRDEVARLRITSGAAASNSIHKVLSRSDPDWRDWMKFRPLDLAQFPDSETEIERASAIDVGTATPAALLQTWIWAQRINDASAVLKTWDFPEGTTDERKMERVAEMLRDGDDAQQNPDRVGHHEHSKLRDLFTLGDGYYLALIEQGGVPGKNRKTFVSHQIFRRVGDEWKVCVGKLSE